MKNKPFFKTPEFYFCGSIILGAVLRVYHLAYESLWADEAFSVFVAKKSFTEIIISCAKDVHPPLYQLILKYWVLFFGTGEFAIRSLSVIFGILTIYLIYRLASLLYDKTVGVIAGYVSASSAFLIQYSQEARSYSLLTCLSVLSFFLFFKWLKKGTTKNCFYLLFVNVLLSYTHIFGLTVIASELVFFFILFKKTGKNVISYLSLNFVNALLFVPWLPVALHQAGLAKQTGYWMPYTDFHSMFIDVMRRYSGGWTLFTFAICFPLLLLGIPKLKKVSGGIALESFESGIAFIVWLLIPMVLCTLLSVLVFPVYRPKNLIVGAPAFYILLSSGICNLSGFKLKPAIGILVCLLGYVLLFGENAIGTLNEHKKENWRDLTQFVMAREEDADVILIYPSLAELPFDYYYRGKSKEIIIHNDEGLLNPDWDLQLKGKLDHAKRIWVAYRLSDSQNQVPSIRTLNNYITQDSGYELIHAAYYSKGLLVGLFLYDHKPPKS